VTDRRSGRIHIADAAEVGSLRLARGPSFRGGVEVTRVSTSTTPVTTVSATIRRDVPINGGYHRLALAPGEPHLLRRDLGGAQPGRFRRLTCFVQLSDLHITDAQSPARVEFLDRFGDADSEFASVLGRIGVYRPQETLTAQVVEAMVRSIARVEHGPLTGAPPEFAFSTGDATDNCQSNELDAYIALLDGGEVVSTDSGELGRFDGVGSPEHFDPRYWHPDGSPDGAGIDLPRRIHNFPLVPGLLDAAIVPFATSGLPLPWYAVYGNHDALFGGTLYPNDALAGVAVGGLKSVGLSADAEPLALLSDNQVAPSGSLWGLLSAPTRPVRADENRRPVSTDEWIARHLRGPGIPDGHGLAFAPPRRCYYGFDAGVVRFLVLDTVNTAGGWQGSIDDEQFRWLEEELIVGSREFTDEAGSEVRHAATDRLFVLVSHHPIETLINDYAEVPVLRHLERDVRELLGRFPNVICWVNGHTHANAIHPIRQPGSSKASGFWQVTTASHIDWPQQSRVIEIAVDLVTGDVVIGTTMIDHLGIVDPRLRATDEVKTLAGWSRELAANAWQGRVDGQPAGRGTPLDRNTLLMVPAPFAMAR
jgi:metallophosphoesterase (TIGR03767 family)